MVDPKSLYREKVSSPEFKIKSTLSTTPLYKNKAFLKQKYEVEKLSARQIAVLIGCSHAAVNRAIKHFNFVTQAHQGGWAGYGFKLHHGVLVPHVREQIIIRRILRWREAKWSFTRIAKALNRSGISTPSKKGKWHASNIKRIWLRHIEQIAPDSL